MLRLLTTPVFQYYGVAGENIDCGVFVREAGKNAAGQTIYLKPTSAGEAALSTGMAFLDPTIYNDPYNGVRNTVASGQPIAVVNGCRFLCDAKALLNGGNFTTLTTGDYLGIGNSGQIAASSPASGTSKFVRFESFVGDTSANSGIFTGKVEAQI